MPRDQIRMPSSSAGVMSFYDEEKSSVKLKPEHVVVLCLIMSVAIIYLNYFR